MTTGEYLETGSQAGGLPRSVDARVDKKVFGSSGRSSSSSSSHQGSRRLTASKTGRRSRAHSSPASALLSKALDSSVRAEYGTVERGTAGAKGLSETPRSVTSTFCFSSSNPTTSDLGRAPSCECNPRIATGHWARGTRGNTTNSHIRGVLGRCKGLGRRMHQMGEFTARLL
jgi:hypothetical protein